MKHCPLVFAAGLAALASSCAPLPPPPGEDPYYPRPRPNYPRPYESETQEEYEQRYDQQRYEPLSPRTEQPAPAPANERPVARKTDNPNQVISPYAPYNLIDVTGFRSGQLAKDPSNQKIFRVP